MGDHTNVAVPMEMKDWLKDQASQHGTTMSELVRRSVRLFDRFQQTEREGGKVVMVDADGKGTRVILL